MTPLFAAAGVDYGQWRALMRAHAFVSMAALRGVHGGSEQRRAALGLAGMTLFCAMVGGVAAGAIWLVRDTWFAATITTTTIGAFVAAMILSQKPSLVTPDDYAIVGCRPVSSRTYFAARAAGILAQTLTLALVAGLLPVFAFLTRRDGSALAAAGAAAAIVGTALAVTASLVAGYGLLLRAVRPERMARGMAIAESVMSTVLAGVLVIPVMYFAFAGTFDAARLALPRSPWILVYPGTWIAAYVEVARGATGSLEIVAAVLSVLLVTGLGMSLRGRLSADYAMHLAHLSSVGSAPRGQAYPWPFLRGETRATLLLLRAECGGNVPMQSHLVLQAVFGAGLTAVLVATAGLPGDPFVAGMPPGELSMMAFAAFYLPVSVYRGVCGTGESDAAWLFHTTPSSTSAIVSATRDLAAILSLIPSVAVLAAFFTYAFGHAGHGVLLAAVAGLVGYTTLLVSVAVRPRLPLANPAGPGGIYQPAFVLAPMLVGVPIFGTFTRVLSRSPMRMTVGIAVLLLVIASLRWVTSRTAGRRAGRAATSQGQSRSRVL